jgi:hypothetical protein
VSKPKALLLVGVLLVAAAAALVACSRPDPRAQIAAAFARYQAALAAGDADGVIAVTSPDSIVYFGQYLRDHALHRTREEMQPRSIWEQYCILTYRDVLGAPFLRTASHAAIYAELVHQHLLLFEVKGRTLGPISFEGKSADAALLKDGKPTGTSIMFDCSTGPWTVATHSNVRYALYGLHDLQAEGQVDKTEFVARLFERLRGKPLDEALWEPQGP